MKCRGHAAEEKQLLQELEAAGCTNPIGGIWCPDGLLVISDHAFVRNLITRGIT
jgi:hypothetical protein